MTMKYRSKNAPKSVTAAEAQKAYQRIDVDPSLNRLIPVRRKKPEDRLIPRINEHQLRRASRADLARLQDLFRGTSPVGRDLYRKTLAGICSRVERDPAAYQETIVYAQCMFNDFPSLEREFKQLFLIERGHKGDFDSVTLDGMAINLVIVETSRLALASKARRSATGA